MRVARKVRLGRRVLRGRPEHKVRLAVPWDHRGLLVRMELRARQGRRAWSERQGPRAPLDRKARWGCRVQLVRPEHRGMLGSQSSARRSPLA